jgi:predicted RNA binding protein with dsRBD fold (UPF0201 family)
VNQDLEARLNMVEKQAIQAIDAQREAAKRKEILAAIQDKLQEVYRDREMIFRLQKIAFPCSQEPPVAIATLELDSGSIKLKPGSKVKDTMLRIK